MGPELDKLDVKIESLGDEDEENKQALHCVNNYEDNNITEEMATQNEDMEVDIIECTKSGQVDDRPLEENGSVTESMSSFGNTSSDNETLSDEIEVNSKFDAYGGGALNMRRKKLTDHWRSFIRPLMWRCKWMELKIQEFQSQAFRYDSQLAEVARRKQLGFVDTFVEEGYNMKSQPFSSCNRRKKAMRRKKRKRVEEMSDTKSYMLQHNLFPYYGSRKSDANGALMNYDCDNPVKGLKAIRSDVFGFQDGWTSLESKGEDNIRENILWKIEMLQLQVHKLRARIEKVVSENPGKFSSVNLLSMPTSGDALTSSDQNPAFPPEDGDRMQSRSMYSLSQHKSDFHVGDLMTDSVVSSPIEANPSDMIERTSHPVVGVSSKIAEEGVQGYKQATKERVTDPKNLGNQQTEKVDALMEKQTGGASEMPAGAFVPRLNFGGKTLPKSCSNVSNNKRKRGKRKSRRGGWNRKSSV